MEPLGVYVEAVTAGWKSPSAVKRSSVDTGGFFFWGGGGVPKFVGYKGSETFDYGYRMEIFGSGAWRIRMIVTCRLWPVGNKEKRFWKCG